MVGFLGRLARRFASNLPERRRFNQWHVGVRARTRDDFEPPEADRFHTLVPPRGHFYADPFPIEVDGCGWVFFEDMDLAAGKAHISCAPLDGNGRPGLVEPALVADIHLSYPFVFERDGEVWMVPESEGDRTVSLYRATDFPRRWERAHVLLEDVRAVDATIHEADGRLWMFVNVAVEGADPNDELCLYSALDLAGPWLAHPMNPIVSDVTRARPAGSIFFDGTHWIRPSQDSALTYGHALVLNRIEVLTTETYREVHIYRIDPGWQPRATGTHTLSRSRLFEAIDWKRRATRA